MGVSIDLEPIDQAALDSLGALGVPVELGRPPDGAALAIVNQASPGPDYLILHPVTDQRSGNVADPYEDIAIDYQVTIVAKLPAGARHLVSRVEDALKAIAIPGRAVVTFVPLSNPPLLIDNDFTPPVHVARPSWRLWITPNP